MQSHLSRSYSITHKNRCYKEQKNYNKISEKNNKKHNNSKSRTNNLK